MSPAAWWRRLTGDLAVALRLVRNGFTVASVLAYPLRRRGGAPHTRLDRRDGTVVVAGPDDDLCALAEELWIARCYEAPGFAFPRGATLVDIGANVGGFALWAAQQLAPAHLVCVEPSPRALARLHRNLARNGVVATVIEAACGRPGRATLWAGALPSGDTLHPPAGEAPAALGEVAVLSLDEVLARGAPAGEVWLKLDCEGAEREVLEHAGVATLARVRGIALEHHPRQSGWSSVELEAWLVARGFAVVAQRTGTGPNEGDSYLYALRR